MYGLPPPLLFASELSSIKAMQPERATAINYSKTIYIIVEILAPNFEEALVLLPMSFSGSAT
jgi:hypothetical protein